MSEGPARSSAAASCAASSSQVAARLPATPMPCTTTTTSISISIRNSARALGLWAGATQRRLLQCPVHSAGNATLAMHAAAALGGAAPCLGQRHPVEGRGADVGERASRLAAAAGACGRRRHERGGSAKRPSQLPTSLPFPCQTLPTFTPCRCSPAAAAPICSPRQPLLGQLNPQDGVAAVGADDGDHVQLLPRLPQAGAAVRAAPVGSEQRQR